MDAVSSLRSPAAVIRPNWRITPGRLVWGLALLALVLRLINLQGRPLWLDEAYSAWFSDQSFHYLWTVVPTYETHPPFFYSARRIWRLLVGDTAGALRGFSVLL